ncbi:hypothetical protein LIER_30092 [Lithospermum erythrorhizon]|uniref:Uncharacterized protein n=1 Tax=Lithospermum erythrorhizon TaxID=34254 RepID=A0AAV3RQ55_LITER
MIQDSSSDDDSLSPVMTGFSQSEDEIETEAGNATPEQNIPLHVESPLEVTLYIETSIDSLFSEEDKPSKKTFLVMRFKYESFDDSSEEEDEDKCYAIDLELYQTRNIELNPAPQPSPNAKVYILSDKYDKPIPVIAYFDTGAGVHNQGA